MGENPDVHDDEPNSAPALLIMVEKLVATLSSRSWFQAVFEKWIRSKLCRSDQKRNTHENLSSNILHRVPLRRHPKVHRKRRSKVSLITPQIAVTLDSGYTLSLPVHLSRLIIFASRLYFFAT